MRRTAAASSSTAVVMSMLLGPKRNWFLAPIVATSCEGAEENSADDILTFHDDEITEVFGASFPTNDDENTTALTDEDNFNSNNFVRPRTLESAVLPEYAPPQRKKCFSCMVVSSVTSGVFAAYFANAAVRFPAIVAEHRKPWKPNQIVWARRFCAFTSAMWVFGAIHNVITY